jgi:enoyl-CoA hydratase
MPIPVTAASDGVFVLELTLPRGNAINNRFIEQMHEALDRAHADEVRALVLTGTGRTFSGGLDLVEIYEYDRIDLARFVDAFDDLFTRMLAFPKPVVAAITGHAIAGGCILAMTADVRIMAPGPSSIGLTEAAIGLPFPAGALEIARFAVPPWAWTEWLLEGRRFSPEEARRDGVVHVLSGEGGALGEAVSRATRLAAPKAAAVQAIKTALREPVLARIAALKVESRARFVDAWFSPETRARIGAVRDALLRKREASS